MISLVTKVCSESSSGALSTQVDALDSIQSSISELSNTVKTTLAASERCKILDWLCSHQYEAQYHRASQTHCASTCEWLLVDPVLLDWSNARSSLLWMHGQVGTGKTIATTYLINHLVNEGATGTLLGYFYYDASSMESLTPETFFGAIIRQFCDDMDDVPSEIIDEYKIASVRAGTPKAATLARLQAFLLMLLRRHASATIIVDGLDESPHHPAVCDFLTSTVAAGDIPLRVFIASRPEVDIRRRLEGFLELAMPETAIDRDISTYIKKRLEAESRLRRMSTDTKIFVEKTLAKDSLGM
jgi:hypothetical protein